MILAAFFLLGVALTTVLASLATPLGRVLGVMDEPHTGKGHKQHMQATPAVGGVILAMVGATIFAVGAAFGYFRDADGLYVRFVSLLVITAMMAIGFLDDRKHLSALLRLLLSIVLFTILLELLPTLKLERVSFVSVGFDASFGIFALPFTLLCLVGLKNAVNMADGRNGLLLGLSLIWNLFFLTRVLPQMLPATMGLTGCLLTLFVFNWRGRLFMGDCGSYGIATYFGILALGLHANAYGNVRTSEIILLFIVPVLDTLRLMITRLRNGRSPLAPDNCHLHHLLDRAIGWRRGWLVYMALVAVPIMLNSLIPDHGVQMIAMAGALYALTIWQFSKDRFPDRAIAAE